MARHENAALIESRDQLLGLRVSHFKSQIRALLTELETIGQVEEFKIDRGIDLKAQVRQFEISLIQSALKLTRGHQKRAACLLQINPTTLNAKIKLYGIKL